MGTRYVDVTDEQGRATKVKEHTTTVDTKSLDGPGKAPGLSSYSTLDGATLNRQGDEFFDLDWVRRFTIT